MKNLIVGVLFLFVSAGMVRAELTYEGGSAPNQPLQEYFAAADDNRDKSVIYIFYNGDQCYQCPQTIALTEQIYNQRYADLYSLFVIDYENDEEYDFISAYGLSEPLSVVLVKIADGQSLGYRKIANPQNLVDSPEDYESYLTGQIDDYLGE